MLPGTPSSGSELMSTRMRPGTLYAQGEKWGKRCLGDIPKVLHSVRDSAGIVAGLEVEGKVYELAYGLPRQERGIE